MFSKQTAILINFRLLFTKKGRREGRLVISRPFEEELPGENFVDPDKARHNVSRGSVGSGKEEGIAIDGS